MKKIILFIVLSMPLYLNSQILIEDKSGDQFVNNSTTFGVNGLNNLALIKINSGDQSLGFNYYKSNANLDPSNYSIHDFSIKGKPTEGYAAVFSSGQFSPGIKIGYNYTKVPLLRDVTNYTDWLTLGATYEVNKYSLYKKDTSFKNQIYSQTFKGLGLSFGYNSLIHSKYILNIKIGYLRNSNYNDLKSVEVRDLISTLDTASGTLREVVKTKTAKEGKYEEFESYPMSITFTRATQTDPAASSMASKLRIGYTIFIKNLVSRDLPKTSAGVIVFFAKQDKNGVRVPLIGLNIQATDPFDVQKKNNGLLERIEIGLTSVFSL